jgi:nucleotide-binding universal stress UspA family protein
MEVSPGVPSLSVNVAALDELTTCARGYLGRLADRLCSEGVQTRTVVSHGQVVNQIMGTADEERADLIAIASHGRGGIAKLFYGSVASALLQHANQPLLMVRSRDSK